MTELDTVTVAAVAAINSTANSTATSTAATGNSADPSLRERMVAGICALLPSLLRREAPEASAGTALMDSLGMTSTSALELVLQLEESLELEISVEDLDRADFDTVGSLADYVAANLLTEAELEAEAEAEA